MTQTDVAERELRQDLAAVFRVASRLDWVEQIGNHLSVMLPDEPGRFLINPRGLLFREVTASSLILCALDGTKLAGHGELRQVAYAIHARIHLRNPQAVCVLHLHPRWLTALSLLEDGELALTHHNNLLLNDRIAYDREGYAPAIEESEGDRIARCLGNRTVLLMAHHGVTVVGPTIAEAFDEMAIAERTAMYQLTAAASGGRLKQLPSSQRRGYHGPWGEKMDARLHLDAWRRVLDREEPDYAS
jgi:ribulose-5-phosphate 4-epimerase/fuculose-1-phosphate aldolase